MVNLLSSYPSGNDLQAGGLKEDQVRVRSKGKRPYPLLLSEEEGWVECGSFQSLHKAAIWKGVVSG